ncbi:hypothetical protein N7475_002843 [Penicillium sp. IBT 31633x]|nr:hypothetical protein N7475_002843 [Penicillium sp. IBT 31633x]
MCFSLEKGARDMYSKHGSAVQTKRTGLLKHRSVSLRPGVISASGSRAITAIKDGFYLAPLRRWKMIVILLFGTRLWRPQNNHAVDTFLVERPQGVFFKPSLGVGWPAKAARENTSAPCHAQ